MHVDNVLTACLFVQIIDILRHDQHFALVVPLKPRQRVMRRIG